MKKSHILIFTVVIFCFAILPENIQAQEFQDLPKSIWNRITSFWSDYWDKYVLKMKLDNKLMSFYKEMNQAYPEERLRKNVIDPHFRKIYRNIDWTDPQKHLDVE